MKEYLNSLKVFSPLAGLFTTFCVFFAFLSAVILLFIEPLKEGQNRLGKQVNNIQREVNNIQREVSNIQKEVNIFQKEVKEDFKRLEKIITNKP